MLNNAKLTLWHRRALFIGIILISINLRAPITSVGVVLSEIQDTFSVTEAQIGLVGVIPLVTFGIFSLIVPKVTRRIDASICLWFSLLFLSLGIVWRSCFGYVNYLLGTFLMSASIQFGNVIIPSLIKRYFPQQLGLLTGLYTVAMNLVGALVTSLTGSLSLAYGWRWTLGGFVFITLITLLVWTIQLYLQGKLVSEELNEEKSQERHRHLFKSKLAWMVTLFMGCQSLLFYTLIHWLPAFLSSKGADVALSSYLSSLIQFANIPTCFIIPILAGRTASQRIYIMLAGNLAIISLLGLFYAPLNWMWLFTILMGVAIGIMFSMALLFFPLKTKHTQDAIELSGMAQALGYSFAGLGPLVFGVLRMLSGQFTLSFVFLILMMVILLIVGWIVGDKHAMI